MEKIRIDNAKANIEASYAQKNQYRGSNQPLAEEELALVQQDSLPLKQKKIEEDYTMFDEQIENEEELPEIIEEAFEEEDSDDGGKTPKDDERIQQKDEIRNLRTQLMTIREKLANKTAKIDQIKDTLKQSAGVTDFDKVLE